ncbi:hypothetical protein DH2020_017781 [Rehmannia glutinosa]|uniref:Fe2OG dioxygenase domain-containing protein n=1 Tax=Rehmannia glutinosa TaxID=99300 RepID=A0ABR0WUJ4_REHGL
MEILMSNWSKVVKSVPENYIFPPDKRPGKHVFPVVNDVPVIDLENAQGQNRADIIQQILSASQEFGFFQTKLSYGDKPTRYREVVGEYSVEARKFLLRMLDLISEGLGLKPGYFNGELSKIQLLSVNHHIPCPNPSLTLGMPEHTDPNLITMLHQCSVPGLQVFHKGQWMNVDPTTDSLIVIPGLQLKVISNGKFCSPIHRVMTHSEESRTTIGTFLIPSNDVVIEPAKDYAADDPVYRGFTYKEFFSTFTGSNCVAETALGCFKNNTK